MHGIIHQWLHFCNKNTTNVVLPAGIKFESKSANGKRNKSQTLRCNDEAGCCVSVAGVCVSVTGVCVSVAGVCVSMAGVCVSVAGVCVSVTGVCVRMRGVCQHGGGLCQRDWGLRAYAWRVSAWWGTNLGHLRVAEVLVDDDTLHEHGVLQLPTNLSLHLRQMEREMDGDRDGQTGRDR